MPNISVHDHSVSSASSLNVETVLEAEPTWLRGLSVDVGSLSRPVLPVLLPILLALSTASVHVIAPNPRAELQRSGAISWDSARRRGQRVSLREARLLALKILDGTNSRLRSERATEFQAFLALDEDSGTSDT